MSKQKKTTNQLRNVQLKGQVIARQDISAVIYYKKWLVIAGDEALNKNNYIQLFAEAKTGNVFSHKKNIRIIKGTKESGIEMDIEALAADKKYLYVIGSHSKKREKLNRSYKKNRSLLKAESIAKLETAANLFRLKLNKKGRVVKKKSLSLARLLSDDAFLAPFTKLPSKENGVDIEGLACYKSKLYAGFRGPVLRGNYVPVWRFNFKKPNKYKVRFVILNGGGIRSFAPVKDGLLLIEGPNGDEIGEFRLLHWNAKDMVPGKKKTKGKLKQLATLDLPNRAKAEGVYVLAETNDRYELLIVLDGVPNPLKRTTVKK